jgi:hypothetical protein
MEKKYRYGLTQTIFALLFAPFLFWIIIPYLFGAVKANSFKDVLYFGVLFTITIAYTIGLLYMLFIASAIILTEEQICIGESGYNIDWKDISHITKSYDDSMYGSNAYIEIYVRDPEKYIGSIRNPILRIFRWLTPNLNNSPFYISLSGVRGDDDEIYHEVLKWYRNFRDIKTPHAP